MLVDPKYDKSKTSREFIDGLVDCLRFEGHQVSINVNLKGVGNQDLEGLNGLLIHCNPFEIEDVSTTIRGYKIKYPNLGILVTTGFAGQVGFNSFFTDSEGCYILMKPFMYGEIITALDDFYSKLKDRNSGR